MDNKKNHPLLRCGIPLHVNVKLSKYIFDYMFQHGILLHMHVKHVFFNHNFIMLYLDNGRYFTVVEYRFQNGWFHIMFSTKSAPIFGLTQSFPASLCSFVVHHKGSNLLYSKPIIRIFD